MTKAKFVNIDIPIATLRKEMPPMFTRKVASQLLGGIISAKTLSNLDYNGVGPGKTAKINLFVGHTVYEREKFCNWLADYLGNKTGIQKKHAIGNSPGF